MTKHTIFVCKSCAYSSTQRELFGQLGGQHLVDQLLHLQPEWDLAAEYSIEVVASKMISRLLSAAFQKALKS